MLQPLGEDHASIMFLLGAGREDTNICIMDSLPATATLMIMRVRWQKQERKGALVPTIKSYLTLPDALPRTQELQETAWWN